MTRLPDYNLDPPEDDMESDVPMLPNSDYTIEIEPPDPGPIIDRDCDYWEKLE
jgi:hypothetical protein